MCAGSVWIEDEGEDQGAAEERKMNSGMRLKCDICKNGLMSGGELRLGRKAGALWLGQTSMIRLSFSYNPRSSGNIHNLTRDPTPRSTDMQIVGFKYRGYHPSSASTVHSAHTASSSKATSFLCRTSVPRRLSMTACVDLSE